MEIIKNFFIYLLLIVLFTGYGQKNSSIKAIAITWIANGGDRRFQTIIGSNYETIDSIRKGPAYNDSPDMETFAISQKALDYLSDYVYKNGDTINRYAPNSRDRYIISLISQNNLTINFHLEEKEEAKPFFNGFIVWIEHSPYKDECDKLLRDIKGYTN